MEIVSYFDDFLHITRNNETIKTPFHEIHNIFKLSNRRTLVEAFDDLRVVDNESSQILIIYEYENGIKNFNIPVFDNFIDDHDQHIEFKDLNPESSIIKSKTSKVNAVTFDGKLLPSKNISCVVDGNNIYDIANVDCVKLFKNGKVIKTWSYEDLSYNKSYNKGQIYAYLKICELTTPTILIYEKHLETNVIYITLIEIVNDGIYNIEFISIYIEDLNTITYIDINEIGIIVNYKSNKNNKINRYNHENNNRYYYKSRIDDYICSDNGKAICNLGIYKEKQKEEIKKLPLFSVLCEIIILYI